MPRNGRFVLSWVYHPRALPLAVPAAALHMAAMRGMEVVVLRPEGFALPPEIMEKARRAAALSAARSRETSDRADALEGRPHHLREGVGRDRVLRRRRRRCALRAASLTDWCVQQRLVRRGRRGSCRLMHCLPVRRNTAVADEVLDSPRSAVQREAYNRLVVQMAVLYNMLKGI